MRKAMPAITSGVFKYANEAIVRSPMWPSDERVRVGILCTSAFEMSPGVGRPRHDSKRKPIAAAATRSTPHTSLAASTI